MLEYLIKPALCNRITENSVYACAQGICEKFEVNPKVNRWLSANALGAMMNARFVISNA